MKPEDFKPYTQEFAANPYPVYSQLRKDLPVFYSEEFNVTFISRYADISKLLTDKRLFRSLDHLLTEEQIQEKNQLQDMEEMPFYNRYVKINILETEGETHSRLRRLVGKVITPARINGLKNQMQGLVNELIEDVKDHGEMDFLEDLAIPLPVYVISTLLGWPLEERHRLRPWSADIVRLYEKDCTDSDKIRAEQASMEFAVMLKDLAEFRRQNPQDDLISALALVEDNGETLSNDELIATCMLILNAGHESTVNSAGNGLLALFRHPDQMQALQDDPALINTAVEEMLRYDSPLHFFHRYVAEDMQFKDYRFSRGDMIGYLYGSANRDHDAFAEADSFDINREPNPHLAFGKGTHFCLGAPLARLELQVIFNTLLQQLPDLYLVSKNPEYHTGLVFRGLKELKIAWS